MWCDCYNVEHRRGVAGGGWEDEEQTEHDTAVNEHTAEQSVSSSSSAVAIDTERLWTSKTFVSVLFLWSFFYQYSECGDGMVPCI